MFYRRPKDKPESLVERDQAKSCECTTAQTVVWDDLRSLLVAQERALSSIA